MELNFTQVGDKYVAEFEVTSDFNLHIEREATEEEKNTFEEAMRAEEEARNVERRNNE